MGSILLAFLAAASTQVAPPPAITPSLQVWRAGEVRCGGRVEPFTAWRPPGVGLAWSTEIPSVTVRFRIDATGRPLGITRTATTYVATSEDILPSLVASRFAAGAVRGDCTVTYAAIRTSLNDAAIDDLIAFSMQPGAVLPKPGWDRIYAAASDCAVSPRPEPLVRAYPAFRTMPGTPGMRDWTMVGFDLTKAGRPVHVRDVSSTGNSPLDRAAVTAVARSRFTPGARRGCRYSYWRAAVTLAAPEPPTEESLRPADATCPAKLPFARQPTLTVPQAYNRRNIEGWAVVAYDVAPWGATGNLRVLAAEPSADFGDWAINVLRPATKAASSTGYVGCVDRVRFRLADQAKLIVSGNDIASDPIPSVD